METIQEFKHSIPDAIEIVKVCAAAIEANKGQNTPESDAIVKALNAKIMEVLINL